MDNLEWQRDEEAEVGLSPSAPESVWIGRYGLRAGWGILLFLGLYIGLSMIPAGFQLALHHRSHEPRAQVASGKGAPHETPASTLVSTHVVPLCIVLAASWVMTRVERRRFGVYGLGGEGRLMDCVKGLATGLIALSLLVGILHSAHLLVFDGLNVRGGTALHYGLLWLAGFCAVSLMEEYLFRGYLQYTLTRGLLGLFHRDNPRRRLFAFWLAVIVLSLLFLSGHILNPGESLLGLTDVFLAGIVLGYSLWRTGSLWWGIGFHTTWDWAQSFLFGVGDSGIIVKGRLWLSHPQGNPIFSGGATGPEGSILFLGIFVLLILTIRFTLPKREQPSLEPETPASPALSTPSEYLP